MCREARIERPSALELPSNVGDVAVSSNVTNPSPVSSRAAAWTLTFSVRTLRETSMPFSLVGGQRLPDSLGMCRLRRRCCPAESTPSRWSERPKLFTAQATAIVESLHVWDGRHRPCGSGSEGSGAQARELSSLGTMRYYQLDANAASTPAPTRAGDAPSRRSAWRRDPRSSASGLTSPGPLSTSSSPTTALLTPRAAPAAPSDREGCPGPRPHTNPVTTPSQAVVSSSHRAARPPATSPQGPATTIKGPAAKQRDRPFLSSVSPSSSFSASPSVRPRARF
jgi:hypothetical protein